MDGLIYPTTSYIVPNSRNQQKFVPEFVMTVIFSFYAACTPVSLISREATPRYTTVLSSSSAKAKSLDAIPEPISVPEKINNIRKSLGLNMSALAELVGSSRPSMYSWIKGEPPQSNEIVRKLNVLASEASKVSNLGLIRVDVLIKRPVFETKSAFDLLKSGELLTVQQLQMLKEIDQKEAQVRAKSASLKPVRSMREVVDELSTPIMQS